MGSSLFSASSGVLFSPATVLLFFLQALCSSYKSVLEALLLDGILRHGKFFVAEAHLVLGEEHVIVILQVFIHGLFIRASLPVLPSSLFKAWLGGIVFIFGIIRSAIISCVGIAVCTLAWFRAAPLMSALRLLLKRIILHCIHLLLAIVSLGVSTIYMSYDEVAVQHPVGGGSCPPPALLSIPSMPLESKSSMSVKSSTVTTKWVVGG